MSDDDYQVSSSNLKSTDTGRCRLGLRLLAAARAGRLCSGTNYLDNPLWMEDRLHVFTPVRMALVLDGPGLPWGLFCAYAIGAEPPAYTVTLGSGTIVVDQTTLSPCDVLVNKSARAVA